MTRLHISMLHMKQPNTSRETTWTCADLRAQRTPSIKRWPRYLTDFQSYHTLLAMKGRRLVIFLVMKPRPKEPLLVTTIEGFYLTLYGSTNSAHGKVLSGLHTQKRANGYFKTRSIWTGSNGAMSASIMAFCGSKENLGQENPP